MRQFHKITGRGPNRRRRNFALEIWPCALHNSTMVKERPMGAKKPRAHLARGEIGTPGGRMARLSTYERDNCGDKKGRPSGGPNRSTGDVTRSLGINSVSNINEKSALPARAREH